MTTTVPFTGRDRVYAFADSVQPRQEPQTDTHHAARWETWVSIALAGETYAMPVESVREILRVGQITRVPDAPYPVRGIINLRGRVVPVVDLRLRLGLPRAETTPQSRILVAHARERLIGLLVDGVEQVVRLDATTFEPPPADVMSAASDYIRAVCQRERMLLILLDTERVLEVPVGDETPAATDTTRSAR